MIQDTTTYSVYDSTTTISLSNKNSEKKNTAPDADDHHFHHAQENLIPPARIFRPHTAAKVPSQSPFTFSKVNVLVKDWQIFTLILTLFLLAFAKAFNSARLQQILKSISSHRTAFEVIREENVLLHRVNILLMLFSWIIVSLYLYQVDSVLTNNVPNTIDFLTLCLVIFGMYVVKFSAASLLAFVFDLRSIAKEYIFTVLVFNYCFGLFLIPILILFYFTSVGSSFVLVYFSIPILILSLLLRIRRFFILGRVNSISFMHIFLYICTLEILPILVISKVFIS